MAMTETNSTARKGKLSAQDRLEYRALFALAFLPCLAAASWQRLFPSGLNRAPQSGSVFSEAKSAAHAAVGYAFIA
ncbi:MAG: hypothetical protein AAFY73_04435 [Pseudomonadota bacterium]